MAVSTLAWTVNTAIAAGLLSLALSWPLLARLAFIVLALVLAVNGVALYGFCSSLWELPAMILTLYGKGLFIYLGYRLRGRTPLFPEWTLGFELYQGMLRCLLENYGVNVVDAHKSASFAWFLEFTCMRVFAKDIEENNTTLERVQINNLEHLWIKPIEDDEAAKAKKTRIVLLYYHGGGYAMFTPHSYIGLASMLRADIVKILKEKLPDQEFTVELLLGNYRKSVTHPFPVPSQDAYLTYEYLLNHEKLSPKQILLAGDSAGGGLTTSAMLRARKNGAPQPLAVALLHPFADVSDNDIDHPYCVLHTRFASACRKQFFVGLKDDSPKGWEDASAAHNDLRGLAPAIIVTSDFDLLRAQALLLKEKADADGLDWELDMHKNMPHVFMMAPPAMLPYTAVGSAHICEFLVKHIVREHRQQQQ